MDCKCPAPLCKACRTSHPHPASQRFVSIRTTMLTPFSLEYQQLKYKTRRSRPVTKYGFSQTGWYKNYRVQNAVKTIQSQHRRLFGHHTFEKWRAKVSAPATQQKRGRSLNEAGEKASFQVRYQSLGSSKSAIQKKHTIQNQTLKTPTVQGRIFEKSASQTERAKIQEPAILSTVQKCGEHELLNLYSARHRQRTLSQGLKKEARGFEKYDSKIYEGNYQLLLTGQQDQQEKQADHNSNTHIQFDLAQYSKYQTNVKKRDQQRNHSGLIQLNFGRKQPQTAHRRHDQSQGGTQHGRLIRSVQMGRAASSQNPQVSQFSKQMSESGNKLAASKVTDVSGLEQEQYQLGQIVAQHAVLGQQAVFETAQRQRPYGLSVQAGPGLQLVAVEMMPLTDLEDDLLLRLRTKGYEQDFIVKRDSFRGNEFSPLLELSGSVVVEGEERVEVCFQRDTRFRLGKASKQAEVRLGGELGPIRALVLGRL